MAGFKTYDTAERRLAVPMAAVIDPADWAGGTLGPVEDWSYRLSRRDADQIVAGVAAFRRSGENIVDVTRENFPLESLAETLGEMHRELKDGRGMIMMRDFPLDRLDREGVAIAYLGIGAYLGKTMVQNRSGHVLGHVKDLGGDYSVGRGYNTRAELRFHSDGCAYVGLLCLQAAKSGGESRIASSVHIYNTLLKSRPDLVRVLCEDFYRTNNGDENFGEGAFWKAPIFSFEEGFFSATGAGSVIDKAQKLDGVPRFTPEQKEAIDIFRKTVDEVAVDVMFQPGDIQFLNNFVALHSRRSFEDWPESNRKRHLLRLWLFDRARPICEELRNSRAGRGIAIKGERVAPIDVEAARALLMQPILIPE